MSMRKTTLCVLFIWRKVTSARRVTRACTTGNPPLEVAPGQRKTHMNSYRHQTVHRGKVDPGVSELPRGNELSRDHLNRPLDYHQLLELNKDFTDTEVWEEINQASDGKVHGVDGILTEAIKAAKDKLVPLLMKLFNTIFSNCLFPSGIIISLFKRGTRTNPSN